MEEIILFDEEEKKSPKLTFWILFAMVLGILVLDLIAQFLNVAISIVGVFPWQYWFVNGLIILILKLWWSEWWGHFYVHYIEPRKKKLSQVMTGWGFWVVSNWWFDNVLYLVVIAREGLVIGGIIMTGLVVIWNSVYVITHEYSKRKGVDWLGLDGIDDMTKDLEQWISKSGASRLNVFVKALLFIPKIFAKLALWMLGKGEGLAFLALSIWTDSFVTLAYIRRGRSGKITVKDWSLFLLSTVVSNAYWSVRSYGIVLIIRFFLGIF